MRGPVDVLLVQCLPSSADSLLGTASRQRLHPLHYATRTQPVRIILTLPFFFLCWLLPYSL